MKAASGVSQVLVCFLYNDKSHTTQLLRCLLHGQPFEDVFVKEDDIMPLLEPDHRHLFAPIPFQLPRRKDSRHSLTSVIAQHTNHGAGGSSLSEAHRVSKNRSVETPESRYEFGDAPRLMWEELRVFTQRARHFHY